MGAKARFNDGATCGRRSACASPRLAKAGAPCPQESLALPRNAWPRSSLDELSFFAKNVVLMKRFLLIGYVLGLCATSAEPLSVQNRYRILRAIAGRGEDDTRNNRWQTDFEGGNPRDVELSRPHDCGTDTMGRIYIADKDSNGILRISADGSEIRTVAATHNNSAVIPASPDTPTLATEVNLLDPNGLHVFADGSFLTLDLGEMKVRRVNTDGICETLFTYSAGFGNGRGLVAPLMDRALFLWRGDHWGEATSQKMVRSGGSF